LRSIISSSFSVGVAEDIIVPLANLNAALLLGLTLASTNVLRVDASVWWI
jgi:hypothetical protein